MFDPAYQGDSESAFFEAMPSAATLARLVDYPVINGTARASVEGSEIIVKRFGDLLTIEIHRFGDPESYRRPYRNIASDVREAYEMLPDYFGHHADLGGITWTNPTA